MKKFYSLLAMGLSAVTLAQAQKIINVDCDIEAPFGLNKQLESSSGVTFVGSTATIKYFCLNVGGLPRSYANSAVWQPITLSNGAAVKFYDSPEYAVPDEDNFAELDEPNGFEESWDDCAEYLSPTGAYENDWVIEGEGNEIYLDSYCTFGGTITGSGEVTLYVGNKTTLNFTCGIKHGNDTASFVGTIFIKPLDGYKIDTINVGTSFAPGWPSGANGYMNTKTYAGCTTVIDISAFGGDVVWNQSGANSLVYAPMRGKGTIRTGNMPYFNGLDGEIFEYDADIELSGSETHDFEIYGASQAFNGQIRGQQRFMYCRSAAEIYFNSTEPSCSDFVQSFSQRGAGFTGGTGWADINYAPNGGRANTLSAGYPYNTVGQMIWKNIWMYSNNALLVDFDNEGHSDIINVTGTYTMYEGQNEVKIGLPDNFQPKAGKYRVINGEINAGLATYVDTIGYEIWDNNGPAYVIRSVKGGEVIALADGTNNEYVAQPGDSIGVASFGQLAGTYGATVMDGNRPYYEIIKWGPGSYSNGESTDGDYKNTEDPKLYTANENQIGTAASDPDSTKWQAVWDQFVADHPVSDAWVAVTPEDASVIPGTITDSIFLTYSRYHAAEGSIAGEHSWSYGNNANSAVSGYPYAHPITYAYYYYSNNTLRLQSGATSSYLNASNAEDTLGVVSFAQRTFPIYLTQNRDSAISEIKVTTETIDEVETEIKDTIWTFVTDTIGKRFYTEWSNKIDAGNGDSLQYRFNFKNYISDGIIAIETLLTKANGEIEQDLPAEDDSEVIVNEDDIMSIGTAVKENRVVVSREFFTLDGRPVRNVGSGATIIRTVYSDGSVVTKGVVIR